MLQLPVPSQSTSQYNLCFNNHVCFLSAGKWKMRIASATHVTWEPAATLFLHRVSKNVPPLACYNFDTCDKVGNQKTLHYATSNNLCFCTTCRNWETWKSHFTQLDCVTHTMHLCAVFRKDKKCNLWITDDIFCLSGRQMLDAIKHITDCDVFDSV